MRSSLDIGLEYWQELQRRIVATGFVVPHFSQAHMKQTGHGRLSGWNFPHFESYLDGLLEEVAD